MTVRQLIPAMLVASLLGAATLSPWVPGARWALLLIGVSYVAFVLACSASAVRTEGLRTGIALAAVFPTLHFSYGVGFLRGVYQHLLARNASPAGELGLSR